MIAELHNGLVGTKQGASNSISHDFTTSISTAGVTSSKPMNFDGGLGLSTKRRESLPVVLFPAFREFGQSLRPAADAVYRLQQASLEFRVVAVTDMSVFKNLRPFGWAISHLHDEVSWTSNKQSWIHYVSSEMDKVSSDFGSVMTVQMSESGISDSSWIEILSLAKMTSHIRNPTSIATMKRTHYSWRGWLASISGGSTKHIVDTAECEWSVHIHKSPNSSMVYLHTPTPDQQSLARSARERGWNCVQLSITRGTASRQGTGQAIDAILDGLSLGGAGIVTTQINLDSFSRYDHACIFTREASENDFDLAERKALAFWSSGLY